MLSSPRKPTCPRVSSSSSRERGVRDHEVELHPVLVDADVEAEVGERELLVAEHQHHVRAATGAAIRAGWNSNAASAGGAASYQR